MNASTQRSKPRSPMSTRTQPGSANGAAEAEELAQREGRSAGFHDERATERERDAD